MTIQERQTASSADYSIGDIISETFRILMGSPAKFLLVAAITVIPAVIGYVIAGPLALVPGMGTAGWVVLLFRMIIGFLTQAAITYGAFEILRGRDFDVAHAISSALARFGPLALLSIALSLMIGVGSALLLVPGLIILCMYYVSLAVCVVEKTGVGDSLGRSRALTKGFRWKILGQLAVLFIPLYVLIFAITYVFRAAGSPMLGIGIQQIVGIVLAAITSILASVTYFRLRNLKEGVDLDRIASVFD